MLSFPIKKSTLTEKNVTLLKFLHAVYAKVTSLTLKKERRSTLSPPALVAATRHIETRDSLVPVRIVVDWYRDALVLRIRVSGVLRI